MLSAGEGGWGWVCPGGWVCQVTMWPIPWCMQCYLAPVNRQMPVKTISTVVIISCIDIFVSSRYLMSRNWTNLRRHCSKIFSSNFNRCLPDSDRLFVLRKMVLRHASRTNEGPTEHPRRGTGSPPHFQQHRTNRDRRLFTSLQMYAPSPGQELHLCDWARGI